MSPDATVEVIQTSAACAMLHSFHTEIEKILKLIARHWDGRLPSSDSWHNPRVQMSQETAGRPAVPSLSLVEALSEFLTHHPRPRQTGRGRHGYAVPPVLQSSPQLRHRATASFQPANSRSRTDSPMAGSNRRSARQKLSTSAALFQNPVASPAR